MPNVLVGGPGDDVLDGGRDLRRVDDPRFSGAGVITCASSGRPIQVNLSGRIGHATGDGHDTIVLPPRLVVEGSSFDDVMVGSDRHDHLVGGPGDDTLRELGGDDSLNPEAADGDGAPDDDQVFGGPGEDVVNTFKGSDVLRGGPGDDGLLAYSRGLNRIYGGAGDDELVLVVTTRAGRVIDGGAGHDTAELASPLQGDPPSDGPVVVTVRTGPGALEHDGMVIAAVAGLEEYDLSQDWQWSYYGTDAPDVVKGGFDHALNAWTYGGHDVVQGTARNDHIYVGLGHDRVDGGQGRDLCRSAEKRRHCEQS